MQVDQQSGSSIGAPVTSTIFGLAAGSSDASVDRSVFLQETRTMVRNRLVNRARARVAFIQVGFKKLKNGLFMVVFDGDRKLNRGITTIVYGSNRVQN